MKTRCFACLFLVLQLPLLLLLHSCVAQQQQNSSGIEEGASLFFRHDKSGKVGSEHAKICGHEWHSQFLRRQEAALANPSLPTSRFFVSASSGSGTTDRLVGLLTGFYAALLSNRSFLIMTYSDAVPWDVALDNPFVNLTLSEKEYKVTLTDINARRNDSQVAALIYDNGEPLFTEGYREQDPAGTYLIMADNPKKVIHSSNRGNIYNLLKDSPYSTYLQSLGIVPRFGVYCAFHFLFRPKQEVLELARPYTSQLLADKDTIKIGIQIRTGDIANFWHKEWGKPVINFTVNSTAYYENFFECALFLENKYENPNVNVNTAAAAIDNSSGSSSDVGGKRKRKVLWYLMSDSLPLRISAKKLFGDKLVTNTKDEAIHTAMGKHEERILGMKMVFSEVITMAQCDFFILSHNSGIGKLGAWLSKNHMQNAFFQDRSNALLPDEPKCIPYPDEHMAISNQGL